MIVEGDPVDSIALRRLFHPLRDLRDRTHSRRGAVHKKVALGKRFPAFLLSGYNFHIGKSVDQFLLNPLANVPGPQCNIHLGQIPFQQSKETGSVGDVSDVDRLPRGAKQDATSPPRSSCSYAGRG